jgi:hypothetical protein
MIDVFEEYDGPEFVPSTELEKEEPSYDESPFSLHHITATAAFDESVQLDLCQTGR